MKKRIATIAVGLLSVPVLGGIAYGAAHAVSATPAPQQIFPVSSSKPAGADDPVNHDAGDDHGVDDPATHDVGDDHGGVTTTTSAPSTTATTLHDAGDDHGVDDPATHDVGDDHSGNGSGRSDNSGRGRGSGGGGDDSPNHD
jgi:hypothetical protein